MQPHFPMEDLSEDNTEVLKYILCHDAGVDGQAGFLKRNQRYIYSLASKALGRLGIKTQYSPPELYSFSHGFASFETISDLVHPPRIYSGEPAVSRVAQYFVDTRSLFDIEADREIFGSSSQAEADNDASEYLQVGNSFVELPLGLAGFVSKMRRQESAPIGHDRPNPERAFMSRRNILPEQYPNTYDVVIATGEARGETMSQLQTRVAGAQLARILQTLD